MAFTASTDAVPVPSMGTTQEVRPLTSSPSRRGQSSGGALWRAVYTPGDRRTSRVCSLSLWRVARGSKLMRLELIHGLFIT